ncbi:MAG: hypothetical protein IKW11_02005 [Bacteroidales bacterium]|nr:hypothetical protein [Bacteroidales bacterium]
MRTIIRTILASAVCMIAASCLKDASFESGKQNLSEPLTISTETQTKTSLNGSEVHWSSDDVVAIFDNSNTKNRFQAVSTNGNNAEFSGEVTSGTTMIYAVYPYDLANSANGSILNVTIPVEQTSKEGSFAEEHNISVAKAVKTPGVEAIEGITFKNVCALLKFTVPAYLTDVTKVTLSSNSVIAGDMVIDYSEENPTCTMSAEGSKSISMTGAYAAESTFWFVLAPGTLDGINVNVETSKGTYSMSSDNQFEMTAGNYRNLGTLELKKVQVTSATAAHTYREGVLTGTQVNVNLGIDQTTASYITAVSLQIKNAEGTVLRTLTLDSTAESVVMPAEGSWPYLPKGDYTVSGAYTLSGVTEKTIEDITFSVTESPVFEMTATTPYTSYDKYLAGDAAGANSLDGSTIYNVGATVSVSDAILNNANYPSLSITDNDAQVSAGNLTGRSWGKHTIKASYTLDGVTASSEASVDVTGLPYSHTFYDNEDSTNSTWTCKSIQYTISKCAIFYDGTYGYMFSPKFNIPSAGAKISYTIGARFYMPKAFNASKETCELYVGATSNNTTPTTTNKHTFNGNNSTNSSHDSCAGNLDLSAGTPYVSLDSNDKNYSTTLNVPEYLWLHNISIKYRN